MREAGYFTQDSLLRQVVGDRVTGLAGPRSLLVMATHPVAFQGFFTHTGSLDDPYERLQRTAVVMNAVAFGSRAEADRRTRRVRAMHARVVGVTPEPAGRFAAGTSYRGDDPELLLWILGSLAESAMLVYQRYVRPLPDAEREALWQDYRVVGELFGIPRSFSPPTVEAFDAYMARMYDSGDLYVTPRARAIAVDVVMRPPVPLWARGLLELVNQTTIGLLPPVVRQLYGWRWDPARGLVVRGGAEYLRRVVVPLIPSRARRIPPARAAA
jgi:uncharacterized protein (DUF2236 family)